MSKRIQALSVQDVTEIVGDGEEWFIRVTGKELRNYHHQCHQASLEIVKSAFFGVSRVLRGGKAGIIGQHSWVALTDKHGVYDPRVVVLDPTLWSYSDGKPCVHVTTANDEYYPHGKGSIWDWGKPESGDDPPIELSTRGMSSDAKLFLELIGPLDRRGWSRLFNAPMEGWPAGEILEVASKLKALTALIPIDRLGMLTDLNPSGVYIK